MPGPCHPGHPSPALDGRGQLAVDPIDGFGDEMEQPKTTRTRRHRLTEKQTRFVLALAGFILYGPGCGLPTLAGSARIAGYRWPRQIGNRIRRLPWVRQGLRDVLREAGADNWADRWA